MDKACLGKSRQTFVVNLTLTRCYISYITHDPIAV